MNKDNIDRKILFLMSQYGHVSHELYERWKIDFVKPGNTFPSSFQFVKKIYDYADRNKISSEDISNIWEMVRIERYEQKKEYKQKPIRVRKDNKAELNYGSGYSYGSSGVASIRYPKKCRKTAWKRFYKLFPHLKETTK